MSSLGPITEMQLGDPRFSSILWKLTPASFAVRLSEGRFITWNYVQLLSRKLVDVAAGRCRRLIIVIPPRHGKSEMVSKWFTPWYLENYPNKRVILASYEADFATKWGGRARDIVLENQDLLTLRLKGKVPAMHHWETMQGGAMMCAGVGGPITGKGADVFIIDDPCKNPISKSTPVTMADGSLKVLGEVCVGDRVITKLGRPRPVTEVFERGECDCVKLTTHFGRELTVEMSHPCLTLFGWKRGGEIVVGDHLCTPKTFELEPSCFRTAEEHRLVGYILGDGCCNAGVQMAAFEPALKQDFVDCAAAVGLRTTSPDTKSFKGGQIYVSGGIDWAKSVGIHGKVAATKEVPPWVFASPLGNVANFIGAYFATDGHVNSVEKVRLGEARRYGEGTLSGVTGANVQFDSVSKALLQGVQSLLTRFTICSKLRRGRVKYRGEWRYYWTLKVSGMESVRTFAGKIPVHHGEKSARLAAWLEVLPEYSRNASVEALKLLGGMSPNSARNIAKGSTSGLNLSPIGQDFAYDRVVSVELCRAECRCIAVEEDSSFVANDLIVHNSEEANSLTIREKQWDWYTSTARSRLEPGGSFVIMATRWHSDDLIGRVLAKEQENIQRRADGDMKSEIEGWEVFCFPAEATPEAERHYLKYGVKVNDLRLDSMTEKRSIREIKALERGTKWTDIIGRTIGTPLCPDRYDERDLAKFKSLNSRDWYALFQQMPGDEADDGNTYTNFNELVNCKTLVRDPHMPLFVAVDFNVNPMCVLIGQYEKGMGDRSMERCEVLEELVLPNSNTPDMMKRLVKELQKYKWGYTLEIEVYGDAAGSQRSPNSPKTNWQIVAEYFALDTSLYFRFFRRKANPLIGDRVNAVNTMLRAADGISRLYIDDVRCPELVKDMKKVRWLRDASGNSTGMLDKSDPKRTHISDALGYQVEFRFALRSKAGGRKGILQ